MPHPYDTIVLHLSSAFSEISNAGLSDVLPKGGVGTILLAHKLGHLLVPGDKGADAKDASDNQFEYKVSITDQFNFHFGARPQKGSPRAAVVKHFNDIEGAYCALRKDASFLKIAYCPSASLVRHLSKHFKKTDGGQLNKNFRPDQFLKLPGATLIYKHGG